MQCLACGAVETLGFSTVIWATIVWAIVIVFLVWVLGPKKLLYLDCLLHVGRANLANYSDEVMTQ
ncbi:hypothetical protein Goshw_007839 [Gossypium schwendimanii]|uniref:Uncharacterized protein n=1 Tax=Gossypium schwendimanii TaxID=34291 RepID=A0A7J9LUM5_GOSSC|nr:hypothetical protein [Gossypium schwendimanii]